MTTRSAGGEGLSLAKRRLLESLSAETQAADEPALLVQMAGDGSEPADAVLVHAVGGAIFCYAQIARALAASHTVWGLQGQLDIIRATVAGGTRDLAEAYLDRLPMRRSTRPLVLAGWSYGGLVAWEMADLVRRAAPERHVRVLLLDTAYPPVPETPPDESELYEEFVSDMLQQSTRGADADSSGEPLTMGQLAARTGLAEADLAAYHEMFCHNTVAFLAYQPTPSDLCGWAIRAERSYKADWETPTTGVVRYVDVAGDHYSFLNADDTARQLATLHDEPMPGGGSR
jgi:thioesterase domain-containing protein